MYILIKKEFLLNTFIESVSLLFECLQQMSLIRIIEKSGIGLAHLINSCIVTLHLLCFAL